LVWWYKPSRGSVHLELVFEPRRSKVTRRNGTARRGGQGIVERIGPSGRRSLAVSERIIAGRPFR
jgi:hypothetical protein